MGHGPRLGNHIWVVCNLSARNPRKPCFLELGLNLANVELHIQEGRGSGEPATLRLGLRYGGQYGVRPSRQPVETAVLCPPPSATEAGFCHLTRPRW